MEWFVAKVSYDKFYCSVLWLMELYSVIRLVVRSPDHQMCTYHEVAMTGTAPSSDRL